MTPKTHVDSLFDKIPYCKNHVDLVYLLTHYLNRLNNYLYKEITKKILQEFI